jgi:fructokinase
MEKSNNLIVGIGEILWDMLPEGKQLGGAPANFAYHASQLGDSGIVASRVGTDELGKEIIETVSKLNLPTQHIQTDEIVPTGTVAIEVDQRGQPKYTITEEVAWDYLEWTNEWEVLAEQCDAVCFGSLAQRSGQSLHTIRRFLRATSCECVRVFDVNLRQAYFTADRINEGLLLADIVKLNDQELPHVMRLLGLKNQNLKTNIRMLLETFGLKLVCLTRGHLGCMLMTEQKTVEHAGFKVKVADTVGAGDAFTAALVYHYLRGTPLEKMAEAANRLGSLVASKPGATPVIDKGLLAQVQSTQPPQPKKEQQQRRPGQQRGRDRRDRPRQ